MTACWLPVATNLLQLAVFLEVHKNPPPQPQFQTSAICYFSISNPFFIHTFFYLPYYVHCSAWVFLDSYHAEWQWVPPSKIVFQEQSYSSLHSERSLAWDHFRSEIDDPSGVIADFCGVIADFCRVIDDPWGIVTIPEEIGGRRSLRDSLNIIKCC